MSDVSALDARPLVTPTGYARLTTRQARTVLLALLGFTALCLLLAPPPLEVPEEAKPGDVALYRAEVDRVHAGENYYHVAAQELPARGYPTRSVFNWRTPLPMVLIAHLPTVQWGKGVLCLLGLALSLLAFTAIAREDPRIFRRAVPAVVLLLAALSPYCLLGDLFVMPLLWAGLLIGVSICAYSVNRPFLAAAAGLAAVFCRDLALPYAVLGAVLAAWQGRRKELRVWLLGLAGWALFFALHWLRVGQFVTPQAVAHREGWIQFGGATFVLSTIQMNACLLLLPTWVTVLYFVAAMFGLAGWQTLLGLRTGLTVCLFVIAFSIVGHDFNRYWGLLITPLLCFGVAQVPAAVVDLWTACRWRMSVGNGLRAVS